MEIVIIGGGFGLDQTSKELLIKKGINVTLVDKKYL
jgi:NADH dehydrogenase FAD-containing subunit